ncbi:hypothetical protein RJT34_05963 [Clitoria ternatea]|uniref:Uncharacterized protein n=1 Tax=Clitoria ternatea TaxID=43366 RepID=A0AAN9K3N2_CLITE
MNNINGKKNKEPNKIVGVCSSLCLMGTKIALLDVSFCAETIMSANIFVSFHHFHFVSFFFHAHYGSYM